MAVSRQSRGKKKSISDPVSIDVKSIQFLAYKLGL